MKGEGNQDIKLTIYSLLLVQSQHKIRQQQQIEWNM